MIKLRVNFHNISFLLNITKNINNFNGVGGVSVIKIIDRRRALQQSYDVMTSVRQAVIFFELNYFIYILILSFIILFDS